VTIGISTCPFILVVHLGAYSERKAVRSEGSREQKATQARKTASNSAGKFA